MYEACKGVQVGKKFTSNREIFKTEFIAAIKIMNMPRLLD
jgi:hypothetical protein